MPRRLLPIAADQNAAPVLLSAPADAKPQAALVEVVGRHKEGDRTIEGRLVQKTMLVRGDNNREVWSYVGNRMAVAVTEPVPFHIEIVPPKVPLVQNGNMELKVTATRDGGFKGAITLRMLYNPPGVSSPDSVTIPEGQTQAVIPLTADGGAAMRTWKIAVLGESTTGDGPLVVSSQLADLEVAEPRLRFQFQPAAVEQGQKTSIVVKIEKTRKLEAPATIELLGLPNEVTSEPRQIDDAAGEVIFPITTTVQVAAGPAQDDLLPGRGEIARRADHARRGRRRTADPAPLAAQDRGRGQARAQTRAATAAEAGRGQAAQPPGAIAIGEERAEAMRKARNPKSEIRNPKQIRSRKKKGPRNAICLVLVISHLDFVFVSDFGFRISDFCCLVPSGSFARLLPRPPLPALISTRRISSFAAVSPGSRSWSWPRGPTA